MYLALSLQRLVEWLPPESTTQQKNSSRIKPSAGNNGYSICTVRHFRGMMRCLFVIAKSARVYSFCAWLCSAIIAFILRESRNAHAIHFRLHRKTAVLGPVGRSAIA